MKARKRASAPRPDEPVDLIEQANALLASPAAIDALTEAAADLMLPSNDRRGYVEKLLGNERDRLEIAAQIIGVHHTESSGRHYVSVGLKNPRNRSIARAVAERMRDLFEAAGLYHHPDPHDQTRFADRTQRQPARHEFGRERRSLPSKR